MLQIREMLENETEEVLGLWIENCLESTGKSLSENELSTILRNIGKYTSNDSVYCIVAEEENELVGFITAYLTSHPILRGLSGEIEEIYVTPHRRRSGLGLELVKYVVSLMQTKGITVIRTKVSVKSQLAKKFWKNLSWENDMTIFSLYDNKWPNK